MSDIRILTFFRSRTSASTLNDTLVLRGLDFRLHSQRYPGTYEGCAVAQLEEEGGGLANRGRLRLFLGRRIHRWGSDALRPTSRPGYTV